MGEGQTMSRWVRTAAISTVATLLLMLAVEGTASAASTISLLRPQSNAFAILGYSCGGIQEQSYATGFDPTSGFPTGDVYMQTTCNGSGRGGHSTTYTAWAGVRGTSQGPS